MNSTTSKWLLGCGIGCGVVIIIVAVLCGTGYYFIRGTVQSFQDVDESNTLLIKELGEPESFGLYSSEAVPPKRLELFLALRDSTALNREKIEKRLAELDSRLSHTQKGEPHFGEVMGLVKEGFSLMPDVAGYIAARNYKLLNGGMSLGEYYYLYGLIYYSWLDKDLGDGPPFPLTGRNNRMNGFRFDYETHKDTTWAEEKKQFSQERRERIIRRFHDLSEAMIRTSLETARGQYALRLKRELKVLEDNPDRILWQEGLPSRTRRSLEPFREKLQASYSSWLSSLEFADFD